MRVEDAGLLGEAKGDEGELPALGEEEAGLEGVREGEAEGGREEGGYEGLYEDWGEGEGGGLKAPGQRRNE